MSHLLNKRLDLEQILSSLNSTPVVHQFFPVLESPLKHKGNDPMGQLSLEQP
jgi:hypothetical protein